MWHVRDQAQEKLIPISVLHIWQLDIRQWIYLQDENQRIFPISFSNAAFSAVVSHSGTNAETAAIIKDLSKYGINIAVDQNSSNFAYAVIVGY